MRGRPFRVDWGQEDTEDTLKATYEAERDIELRTRLHGLWLLRSGWRLPSVAVALGVHYRTVPRWVGWYREGGLQKVVSHKMGGKGQQPYLSNEAQEGVSKEVSTGRFRTAGEIRDWIADHYGVTYKIGGIYSLMHRLGCSTKVPRPIHTKTDPEQQEAWKKGGSNKPLWKLE